MINCLQVTWYKIMWLKKLGTEKRVGMGGGLEVVQGGDGWPGVGAPRWGCRDVGTHWGWQRGDHGQSSGSWLGLGDRWCPWCRQVGVVWTQPNNNNDDSSSSHRRLRVWSLVRLGSGKGAVLRAGTIWVWVRCVHGQSTTMTTTTTLSLSLWPTVGWSCVHFSVSGGGGVGGLLGLPICYCLSSLLLSSSHPLLSVLPVPSSLLSSL